MNEIAEMLRLVAPYGPGGGLAGVFLWLYLRSDRRCEILTTRLADSLDKGAAASERTAVAMEGMREIVRAGTTR